MLLFSRMFIPPPSGGPAICPTGDPAWTLIERVANQGAWQSVIKVGKFFYVTSVTAADGFQKSLRKLTLDGVVVAETNFMKVLGINAHSQINGMYYHTDNKIYITANNFNTSPKKGWILIVDPDTLICESITELTGGEWSEGFIRYDNKWFEINASSHTIREFNDSFVLQNTFALPDTDPGQLYWNGIMIIDDVFYVNLHEGVGAPDLRAYTFNGSAFTAATAPPVPPATDANQGMYSDNCGFIYWVGRDVPNLEGDIITTTLRDGLTLYAKPELDARENEAYAGFTPTPYNGSSPYTYVLHADSGALPAGLSVNGTTGAVTGTPTVNGSFSNIIIQVTDNASDIATLAPFTLEVFPAILLGFEVTIAASKVDERLFNYPLRIDLADMPANFWSNVNADGGDIRAYCEHGSTELPIDVVNIDTGAETGILVVKTLELSPDNSNIITVRLDGGGLYAADATYGSEAVWPIHMWIAVYAFDGNLLDRTANGNHLTKTGGTGPTYATYSTGLGGGIDTSSAVLQLADTSLVGLMDVFFPVTFMVSGTRRTETSQNQFLGTWTNQRSSAIRTVALGETNATSKYSYFNTFDGFHDSSITSTIGVHVVMHGNFIFGDEKLYVNGVLELSNITGQGGPSNVHDTLVIGDAASSSSWRGDINWAYLASEEFSAAWISLEYENYKTQTLMTIAERT